jgi:hypothetical protein
LEKRLLQDDATGWAPVHIYAPVGVVTQIYVFFILAVVIVTFVELMKIWIGAPPFRLSRQAGNFQYLSWLEKSQSSLRKWMVCTLIAGSFALSANVTRLCDRFLMSKTVGAHAVLYGIRELSVIASLALVAVFLLFSVRWHVLSRADYLRRQATLPDPKTVSKSEI